MCETYLGQVENLDYKTMRYPGHVKLMNFFFHELLMRERREVAGKILTHAKPPVDDMDGRLQRREFVRSFYPRRIAGQVRTAIAWTTSASACAVIELTSNGTLPNKGFLKQERIPLEPFLQTKSGALFGPLDEIR